MQLKCLCISFFNSTNIGDLVLSNCLKEQILKHNIEVKTLSYSQNPDIHVDINNIPQKNAKNSIGLRHNLKMVLSYLGFNNLMFYFFNKKEYLNYEKKQLLEEEIKKSDFVVIGGGNMIFDIFPYSLSAARFNYFIDMIKKYDKKILVLSIGIGPFINKKQLKKCVEVLEKVDYISFRDNKSYLLYSENKISNKFNNYNLLSADPAFNLRLYEKNNDKKYVLLNVINPNLIYNNKNSILNVTSLYISIINHLSKKYNLMVFATEQMDVEYILELKEHLNFNYIEINGFNDLIDLYSKSMCLIGTRMHSVIIALTQNIPVYGLVWQDKVEALFDMLELSEYKQNIVNCDISDIFEQIQEYIENHDYYSNEVNVKVNKARKQLDCNNKYINLVKGEL